MIKVIVAFVAGFAAGYCALAYAIAAADLRAEPMIPATAAEGGERRCEQ